MTSSRTRFPSKQRRSPRGLLLTSVVPIFFMVFVLPLLEDRSNPIPTVPNQTAHNTLIFHMASRHPVLHHAKTKHKHVCHGYTAAEAPRQGRRKIKTIAVLGERHTGRLWLEKELVPRFPRATVVNSLTRPRFMFQSEALLRKSQSLRSTLVIVLVRNPYSWMKLMHQQPEHSPDHKGLSFAEFTSAQWTPKRRSSTASSTGTCQYKFQHGDVEPCRAAAKTGLPLYEHDPATHLPFANIFRLRKAKMEHYRTIQQWVPNVMYIKLEQMRDVGPDGVARMIQATYPSLHMCLPKHRAPEGVPYSKTVDSFTEDEYSRVFCGIDWQVERDFGYNASLPVWLRNGAEGPLPAMKCADGGPHDRL